MCYLYMVTNLRRAFVYRWKFKILENERDFRPIFKTDVL